MRLIDLDESLARLFEARILPTNIELNMGSSGSDVRDYQAALQSVGVDPGSIDGIYGDNTRAATLAFQKKHNLRQDGIAGKRTLAKLNSILHGEKTTPAEPKKKEISWGKVKPEIAKRVFDFFTTRDFTDVQSAALVGNFSVESLWTSNPAKALNPEDTNGRSSHGLAQWQGDRWTRLGNFHKTRPENTTLDQQLEFVVHELKTTHARAGRLLKSVTGTDDYALKSAVYFVRDAYEGARPESDDQRLKYARLALKQFSDDSSDQEPPMA